MYSGSELNQPKQVQILKSSIIPQDFDERKVMQMLEEKDRTIRKLSKKIDKLEDTLKKTETDKLKGITVQGGKNDHNMHLQMLKLEIKKSKKLEDVLNQLTKRINTILEDLQQGNSLTDNSLQIKGMLMALQQQKNQSFSEEFLENELQNSINISQEWFKKIDILEAAFKTFRTQFGSLKKQNKNLTKELEVSKKNLEQNINKIQKNEQLNFVRAQLKEERKQREKLRGLLDKTQYQKNQLINKINSLGMKGYDVNEKTKQELFQYSKELNYRIQDLQKEKQDILKYSNKQKEVQLKKYQDFLKRLKVMKDRSRVGKSYA